MYIHICMKLCDVDNVERGGKKCYYLLFLITVYWMQPNTVGKQICRHLLLDLPPVALIDIAKY